MESSGSAVFVGKGMVRVCSSYSPTTLPKRSWQRWIRGPGDWHGKPGKCLRGGVMVVANRPTVQISRSHQSCNEGLGNGVVG